MIHEQKKRNKMCSNCRWYAEFEGVCCNGDSENRGDMLDENETCDK